MNNDYPKWITRAYGIGAVLVTNETEETALNDAWAAEQAAKAAEAKANDTEASDQKDASSESTSITLPQGGDDAAAASTAAQGAAQTQGKRK